MNILHKIKSRYINIYIILSFFIFSILSVVLLMKTHQFMGFVDQAFHLRRIMELKSDILHGSLLPMFSFNQYHGSEVMAFYPYLNLYPIAFISLIIPSKIILIYIWFTLNELLSLLCSYYGSYSYNHSRKISYLFSIIYASSAFFFFENIDDFGGATSAAVVPLVVFGTLNLIKSNKYLELTFGMTSIIYSHVPSAIIAFVFIIIWILFNITKLNKSKIISVFKAFVLTTLLTSIVWIPALITKLMNNTRLYTPQPFSSSKTNLGGIGLLMSLKLGLTNDSSASLSFFALWGILLSIVCYKYLNSVLRKMLWISIITYFIGIKEFPWRYMPQFIVKFFKLFQTSQRFFLLSEILLIYICSKDILIIFKLFNKHWLMDTGFLAVILFACAVQLDYQHICVGQRLVTPIITNQYFHKHVMGTHKNFFQPYRLNHSSQFRYILNLNYSPNYDYYPKESVKKVKLINNYDGIDDYNNKIKIHHVGYNTFRFNNRRLAEHIALPLTIFNNSHLKLYLDGHSINHYPNKYRELVINHVKKGNHQLKIQYVPNIFMVLAKFLTFLFGLIWLIIDSLKVIRRKTKLN